MTDTEIKEGDQVAWQWGGGKPGGTAAEVATEGELTMETKSGNEVKKKADPENPAVRVERSGHDVVKRASELEVEEEGDKHKETSGEEKKEEEKKDGEAEKKDTEEKAEPKQDGEEKKDDEKKDDEKDTNGDAQAGDKRKAEDDGEEKDDSADKSSEAKENGEAPPPKKKGRPAKNSNAPKAEKPKKEPKKAATATGEPRRSGRNRS